MIPIYDKVIVLEEAGEKRAVVIFDEKLHIPVTYEIVRCGMDELKELFTSKECLKNKAN